MIATLKLKSGFDETPVTTFGDDDHYPRKSSNPVFSFSEVRKDKFND